MKDVWEREHRESFTPQTQKRWLAVSVGETLMKMMDVETPTPDELRNFAILLIRGDPTEWLKACRIAAHKRTKEMLKLLGKPDLPWQKLTKADLVIGKTLIDEKYLEIDKNPNFNFSFLDDLLQVA